MITNDGTQSINHDLGITISQFHLLSWVRSPQTC